MLLPDPFIDELKHTVKEPFKRMLVVALIMPDPSTFMVVNGILEKLICISQNKLVYL